MTTSVQTIQVPHLGGSTVGYRFGRPYNASLPTLVLVNSFTTSSELYRPQFADEELLALRTSLPSNLTDMVRRARDGSSLPIGTRPLPTCRCSMRSRSGRRSPWAHHRAGGSVPAWPCWSQERSRVLSRSARRWIMRASAVRILAAGMASNSARRRLMRTPTASVPTGRSPVSSATGFSRRGWARPSRLKSVRSGTIPCRRTTRGMTAVSACEFLPSTYAIATVPMRDWLGSDAPFFGYTVRRTRFIRLPMQRTRSRCSSAHPMPNLT